MQGYAEDFRVSDDEADYHAASSLEVVREPRLQRLAAYWSTCRGGRPMPTRADIDPLDIPWALSRIFVVDRVPPPTHWRYRLAGAEIEQAFGDRSLRGLRLDQLMPPAKFELVCGRWAPLAERGCAIYMRGLIYKAVDRFPLGGRLLLPLADGQDGRVTGMLGMSDYTVVAAPQFQGEARLDIYCIDLPG